MMKILAITLLAATVLTGCMSNSTVTRQSSEDQPTAWSEPRVNQPNEVVERPGVAEVDQPAEPNQPPQIDIDAPPRVIQINLDAGIPTVIFTGSDRLTRMLQERIASNGHVGPANPNVVIEVSGYFKSSGGRLGNVQAPLAKTYNENLERDKQALESEVKSNQIRHTGLHFGGPGHAIGKAISGGSSIVGAIFSNVLEAALNVSGARGSFNNAVAGDPRGKCLANCDEWNKLPQAVKLELTVKQDGLELPWWVSAKATEQDLLLPELTEAAMDHLANALFPGEQISLGAAVR